MSYSYGDIQKMKKAQLFEILHLDYDYYTDFRVAELRKLLIDSLGGVENLKVDESTISKFKKRTLCNLLGYNLWECRSMRVAELRKEVLLKYQTNEVIMNFIENYVDDSIFSNKYPGYLKKSILKDEAIVKNLGGIDNILANDFYLFDILKSRRLIEEIKETEVVNIRDFIISPEITENYIIASLNRIGENINNSTSLLDELSQFKKTYSELIKGEDDELLRQYNTKFKLILSSEIIHNSSITLYFKNIHHMFKYFKYSEDRIHDMSSQNINIRDMEFEIKKTVEVFDAFKFKVEEISGGCNKRVAKDLLETKLISGPTYKFNIMNIYSANNNCGINTLNLIDSIRFPKRNNKVKYGKIRKRFNIEQNTKINISKLLEIYNTYNTDNKNLKIVDKNYDKEFELDKYNYVLYIGNHYYLINNVIFKKYDENKIKRGKLFFDFETRPISCNDYVMIGETKSYKIGDTICRAYYKRNKSNEWKSLLFETDEKTSSRKFLDWLTLEADTGYFYHCYAHFGSRFDFYFITSNFTKSEQFNSEIFLAGYSILSINYKSHTFKDTYKFLSFSLEKLCKDFKIIDAKLIDFEFIDSNNKKIKLTNTEMCFYKPDLSLKKFMKLKQLEPEFWKNYIEYCLYDCISLSKVWILFESIVNNLIISNTSPHIHKIKVSSCITIGSHAKKLLNNLNKIKIGEKIYDTFDLKDMNLFINNDQEKYNFLRKFTIGGISHCNKPGKHLTGIYSIDICSQYPASMVNMKIPIGNSNWVKEYDNKKYGFYKIKNLVFNTNYKLKPIANDVKDNKKILNWSTEKINITYIDSYMIKYLQDNYGLESFDVIKGLVSNRDMNGRNLFDKFISLFFNEKARQDELKSNNDPDYNNAIRETVKLYINAISGKLVENPQKYFKLEVSSDDNNEFSLNGIKYEKTNRNDINNWLTCGVMVYSYSKRLLFEYIKLLPNNSDDVIHIETDSIYTSQKNKKKFLENLNDVIIKSDYICVGNGKKLGNITMEKDTKKGEVAYFLGKKFYAISNGDNSAFKIKGIPMRTLDKNGKTKRLVDFDLYDQVYNLKEDENAPTRSFNALRKHLFGETFVSSIKTTRTINSTFNYKLYK